MSTNDEPWLKDRPLGPSLRGAMGGPQHAPGDVLMQGGQLCVETIKDSQEPAESICDDLREIDEIEPPKMRSAPILVTHL